MGIQFASMPSQVYQLVAQAIMDLASAGGAASAVTSVPEPSKLSAALPHGVYQLDANQILRGQDLGAATQVAWRFLIVDGTATLAAVELSCAPDGSNPQFAGLEAGPFVQATRGAVAFLETQPNVQAGTYELRVLRAPSVYAMAVWLKDLVGSDDIVYPLGDTPTTAGVGGAPPVQSPSSFLSGLVPTANQAIKSVTSTGPSAGGPPGKPPAGGGPPTPTGPPVFNRLAFIKNYANMVAHTWADPNYLQQLQADPVGTLAQAGIPTIPGAEVIIVQNVITGVGQIEDEVEEWLTGNQTGKYLLWLPIAPANFSATSGGGGPTGGGCCCCTPCCSCT